MDKLKKFGKAVLHGRKDYSPVVKKALKHFGDQKIHKIIINRTPLSFFIKAALNLTTLGDFNRRFKKYPHDELFHLRIDVHTPKGVISIEKNEAIFIKARPKTDKKAELRTITDIPSDFLVDFQFFFKFIFFHRKKIFSTGKVLTGANTPLLAPVSKSVSTSVSTHVFWRSFVEN